MGVDCGGVASCKRVINTFIKFCRCCIRFFVRCCNIWGNIIHRLYNHIQQAHCPYRVLWVYLRVCVCAGGSECHWRWQFSGVLLAPFVHGPTHCPIVGGEQIPPLWKCVDIGAPFCQQYFFVHFVVGVVTGFHTMVVFIYMPVTFLCWR